MRTDKKKNIAKVAKVAISNPLATRDKIAELAWVSQWTASNVLAELDEAWRNDGRIVWITDKDLAIVRLWLDEIERRLRDKEELEKMRTSEISQVIKENTARYAIFRTIDNPKWDNHIVIQI